MFLQEQYRHHGSLIVGNQRLDIGGEISINAVHVDARNPVRVVLRFAYWIIQFDCD